MSDKIDSLFERYEKGQISRRGFLAAVSSLLVAGGTKTAAQTSTPLIQATSFNHVTAFVRDVPSATAFYQEVFGLQVLSDQGIGVNLTTGDGHAFFGIYNGPPTARLGLDHICFGVRNFDVDELQEKLASRGIESRIRMRDDAVPELYFNDPDGISVQIQDESYCGGSGYLGNICT
jgi:catechol 2,3-dioxygenase-like lactoylglutathione lyase family enzyme